LGLLQFREFHHGFAFNPNAVVRFGLEVLHPDRYTGLKSDFILHGDGDARAVLTFERLRSASRERDVLTVPQSPRVSQHDAIRIFSKLSDLGQSDESRFIKQPAFFLLELLFGQNSLLPEFIQLEESAISIRRFGRRFAAFDKRRIWGRPV
jgi:hypothetical protein